MGADVGLYLRELDQLGHPSDLVAYLRGSPFNRVLFHANAEKQAKTSAFALPCRAAGFRVGVYTTPGGLVPEKANTQAFALAKLCSRLGGDLIRLDMELPWRSATPDQVLGCCRQAASRGARVEVTTVPGHPVIRVVARLHVAGIAIQVYDRFNRFRKAQAAAVCAAARKVAPDCCFDLPAWNKTPEQARAHLSQIPKGGARTVYWLADNPGIDDLPRGALHDVIRECDPGLRP